MSICVYKAYEGLWPEASANLVLWNDQCGHMVDLDMSQAEFIELDDVSVVVGLRSGRTLRFIAPTEEKDATEWWGDVAATCRLWSQGGPA